MPAQCCVDRWTRLMKENPDMPVFTLLGKDTLAIRTVEFWIREAMAIGVNRDKLAKVQDHLTALVKYEREHPEMIQIPD